MILDPITYKKAGGTDYSDYPIGSVILSASQNVGEEWLRCDGSYINESQYPELTAALGKKTPGVQDAVLGGDGEEYNGSFSTSVLYAGYVWAYWLEGKALLGFPVTGDPQLSIAMTGDLEFLESPDVPVVLSLCGGRIFLAQKTESKRMKLYTGSFSPAASTIPMTALDADAALSAGISGTPAIVNCVPEVVEVKDYNLGGTVQDCFAVCAGESDSPQSQIYYLVFPKSDVMSLTCLSVQQAEQFASTGTSFYPVARSVKRFSRKCSGELFYLHCTHTNSTGSTVVARPESLLKQLFSQVNTDSRSISAEAAQFIASPLVNSSCYIYNASLKDGAVTLRAGNAGDNQFTLFPSMGGKINGVTLSPYAKLFPDSLEYIPAHGLYVIFVGTGILFTHTPLDMDSWGYLDTTDSFGTITQWGGAEFDGGSNTLCLSGRNSYGNFTVGLLRLHEHFDYSNDGAWLPYIASSGVPAWIKATDSPPEEA